LRAVGGRQTAVVGVAAAVGRCLLLLLLLLLLLVQGSGATAQSCCCCCCCSRACVALSQCCRKMGLGCMQLVQAYCWRRVCWHCHPQPVAAAPAGCLSCQFGLAAVRCLLRPLVLLVAVEGVELAGAGT
jgi:hypothetical protein